MIKIVKQVDADYKEVKFKTWKFPAGEVGFKLDEPVKLGTQYKITVKFESNDDIFLTLQAVDALKIAGVKKNFILVVFPYLPYSRQDRVCHEGESFALKIFADILNNTGVNIDTDDIHNEESVDLFHKLYNNDQWACAWRLPKFDVLVAPDKGAENKAKEHIQVERCLVPVVYLNKTRTGAGIKYDDYEYDTIKGNVCVVDDLADGAGTFVSLGEMLRRTQPNLTQLSLYVTHGFFGYGLNELKKYYNKIYVHNLMNEGLRGDDFLEEI